MNSVILYLPEPGEFEEQILEVIETTILGADKEVYRKIDILADRLLQVGNKPSVAVVLARTRAELAELYSIRHLFSGLRSLLILPDRSKETIAKGHAFSPRFLGYLDSDVNDVASVLNKMLMNLNNNYNNSKGGQ